MIVRGRIARISALAGLVLSGALLATACSTGGDELLRQDAGGDGSVDASGVDAFSQPAANLDTRERRRFEAGDVLFSTPWVPATDDPENHRDGLGPIFNAPSCATCHVRDGRAPGAAGDRAEAFGLLFRIGVRAPSGAAPHPTYGGQIQDRAIPGVTPEPTIATVWEEVRGVYDDGTPYRLRRPTYAIPPSLTPHGTDLALSARIAPAMIGLGLLEAIPEEALVAREDPDDADGDGISGRVNRVETVTDDGLVVGRFGWKANVGTLRDQVARAFRDDLGITSSAVSRQPCTEAQAACLEAGDGGSPEISDDRLADVVLYAATLAVPRRRDLGDSDVRAGAALFARVGCSDCHTATFVTGDHPISALAGQTISPFTDLLLHDLGPGLADTRSDGLAAPEEWRTAPLWGLGSAEAVSGGALALLHDGRARSIEEAILWHGGEADAAQRAFVALDAADRARVIAFLESL